MKKIILVFICSIKLLVAYSQVIQDVVYLKNGSVIRGTIIEQEIDEKIRIITKDACVFIYKYSEIEKIVQESEEINVTDYGGKVSLGFSLLGSSIFAIPARYYIAPKLAIETAISFSAYIKDDQILSRKTFVLGPTYYFNKTYMPNKLKVVSNGTFVKAGYMYSELPMAMLVAGWSNEMFKIENKKHSFIMEMGGGMVHFMDDIELFENGLRTFPTIYLKLHWNWYLH